MRIVHFAGVPGSGKTSIIERSGILSNDVATILNNDASADMVRDRVGKVDVFPFKSPCARVRQYRYRIELIEQGPLPELLVTEPPGNCMDVSSPMLNAIYASEREKFDIGPLVTVIDGRQIVSNRASKRNTEGLRTYNMVDESDVILVSMSDMLSDDDRTDIITIIEGINEDARVIFVSIVTGEGLEEVRDVVLGDSKYNRPLYN